MRRWGLTLTTAVRQSNTADHLREFHRGTAQRYINTDIQYMHRFIPLRTAPISDADSGRRALPGPRVRLAAGHPSSRMVTLLAGWETRIRDEGRNATCGPFVVGGNLPDGCLTLETASKRAAHEMEHAGPVSGSGIRPPRLDVCTALRRREWTRQTAGRETF